MRFVKRNWKTILSALVVLFVIAAAIAGTSIGSIDREQKKAMEALQPEEIGEEQVVAETEIPRPETGKKDKTKKQETEKQENEIEKKEAGKATRQPEDSKETEKQKEEKTGNHSAAEKRNNSASQNGTSQKKQSKAESGRQKEQEAGQNTEYPKVTITVPKNEDLRQPEEKKDDDRSLSDGSGNDKDQYETEPVPSGKPLPVDKEDQKVDNEEEFYVTISIDCLTILQNMDHLQEGKEKYVGDGWLLKTTKVKCKKGQTVYDILEQVCKAYSIQMESLYTPLYGSGYIEGIGNLYEFDCGSLSGWMYSVDGWFPNYGCSRYVLKAGEAIQWRYTCNGLGADIGNTSMNGEEK